MQNISAILSTYEWRWRKAENPNQVHVLAKFAFDVVNDEENMKP